MAGTGASVRLIVGLGNPGPKYFGTRHNAGFWFADEVARRHGGLFREARKFQGEVARLQIAGIDAHLLKPATFMNHSGRAVQALANFYKLKADAILIAHDEIDLPPGVGRLKRGGGHGGHNGLRDTVKALGSRDFARLRIGVGHPGNAEQVVPYVLSHAGRDDQKAIERSIEEAADVLPWLLKGEWDRAFQRLHTAA